VPSWLALRIAALAVVVGVAGCGYSLVRYGDGLGEVRSVAVPTPRNDSYEAGVDLIVADALRREFLRRRGVRLVEDPVGADLVLDGRVVAVEGRARSFSSIGLALEYEVTLRLELEARRADATKIAIDPRSLRETERYLASADVEALRKNREEALRQAAAVLAGRIYDALYETLTP
jgi:outer membrane lipopolysaccharide assembly protein LptE/RlpB